MSSLEPAFNNTSLSKPAPHELPGAANIQEIKALLERGADINGKDSGGFTALVRAAMAGSAEIVQLLLDRGAALEEETPFGNTALILAAQCGHYEAARLLIEKGASLEVKNKAGYTAQEQAERYRHPEVVQLIKRVVESRKHQNIYQLLKARAPKFTIKAGPGRS